MGIFQTNMKSEREGLKKIDKYGTEMIIIKYINHKEIIVEFQDEYKTKVTSRWEQFENNNIKNPNRKSFYGVARIGQGKYHSIENGKFTKCFTTWDNMIKRCYDPYELNKQMTYIDCYVCDEWLCFQNFAKWFYKNYYEIKGEKMQLDKDILNKGNKIYSPENCIFVPQKLNALFTKRQNDRGKYLIGVKEGTKGRYIALLNKSDRYEKPKRTHLGIFNTELDAFLKYKEEKEKLIKYIADQYVDDIPKKLYDALYNYKVEITD